MISFKIENVTKPKDTIVQFDLVATCDDIKASDTFQFEIVDGQTAEESAETLIEKYNLKSQLESKILVLQTPVYVEPAPLPPPTLEQVQAQMVEMVDTRAAFIISQLTKFQLEHDQREKAAREFKDSGESSPWISSFADNVGLSNEAAADLILQQADSQRGLLQELGVLRMDKYKIKKATSKEVAEKEFNALYSAIIELETRVSA